MNPELLRKPNDQAEGTLGLKDIYQRSLILRQRTKRYRDAL